MIVPDRQARRDLIRWLLRLLGETSLLRLVVEDGGQPLPFRLLEEAFWALEPDVEHPIAAQKVAWKRLEAVRPRMGQRPVDWYVGILGLLRGGMSDRAFREDLEELARYWSLPELFSCPALEAQKAHDDYHEIHCHFRGAVPFLSLWTGWLADRRWRASLRRGRVTSGRWQATWAEIVHRAAKLRARVRLQQDPACEALFLHFLAERVTTRPQARRCWVRYLAICCTLRRTLLYQRQTAGLALFVKRFDRYSKAQKQGQVSSRLHTERLAIAVFDRFEKEGAVALELRPTLERTRIDLQRKLLDLVRAYLRYRETSARPIRLGLVPSLFKQETLHGAQEPSPTAWKRQTEVWCSQVTALLEVIHAVPALRYVIVGLDAAGKERGCPARAFGPAFDLVHEYHRAAGVEGLAPGRVTRPQDLAGVRTVRDLNSEPWHPIRLGLTCHAGEDFVDPLTGLRHIAETIDALRLRANDRLGHALALALDNTQIREMLARRAGGGEVDKDGVGAFRLHKPRGEHLLDLAWALQESPDPWIRKLIAAALAGHAVGAFGAPADPDRLAEALRAAPHVETWLPSVRYDDCTRLGTEDRVTIRVDDIWHEIFEPLRRRLIDRIARCGIVIESCPTSNCAVANLRTAPLEDLLNHPGLRVAIATDDPALFGAWPSHELARVSAPHHLIRLLRENAAASFIR